MGRGPGDLAPTRRARRPFFLPAGMVVDHAEPHALPYRSPLSPPPRDEAILEATRAALVDLGWSKLTLGDVATRAGVAKTTLCTAAGRARNELVVDAVAVLFDELELPDRGSLAADIEGVVLQFAAILDRPETKTALMAVVAESTRDAPLRERIRTSIVDRQKRLVLEGRARAGAAR